MRDPGAVLDHKYKGDFPDIVGALYRFYCFSKSAPTPATPGVNRSIINSSQSQLLGRTITFGKARCCEKPDRIIGSRFVAARAYIKVAERVHMFSALLSNWDIARRSHMSQMCHCTKSLRDSPRRRARRTPVRLNPRRDGQ
jgi:hypothetical protein